MAAAKPDDPPLMQSVVDYALLSDDEIKHREQQAKERELTPKPVVDKVEELMCGTKLEGAVKHQTRRDLTAMLQLDYEDNPWRFDKPATDWVLPGTVAPALEKPPPEIKSSLDSEVYRNGVGSFSFDQFRAKVEEFDKMFADWAKRPIFPSASDPVSQTVGTQVSTSMPPIAPPSVQSQARGQCFKCGSELDPNPWIRCRVCDLHDTLALMKSGKPVVPTKA